jgi:hypothetical protein
LKAEAEAGVDVDQQRRVAHVGDAADVGQHVVQVRDAQVGQAQRAAATPPPTGRSRDSRRAWPAGRDWR